MPDPQLLVRVGADFSSILDQIKGLFSGISDLGDETASTATKGTDAIKAQLAALRAAAQSNLDTARQGQGADAAKVAALRAQTAELNAQLAVLKTQTTEDKSAQAVLQAKIAISKADTAQAQATLAATQATTNAIQQQVNALKQKAVAQTAAGTGGGGIGGAGGATGGVAGALGNLLGGGLAGGVGGGLLAAGGIATAVAAASEALVGFVGHLKDVITESGKLAQVQDLFQRLAEGAGVNASNALIKLQTATDGLVPKLQLLNVANAAMRGPLKLNSDQIAELTGDVVKLSLASGNTAEQGISALQRALLRGGQGFAQLGRSIGISGDALRTLALPPGIGQIEKGADRAAHAIAEISKQAKLIGDPIETLGMMMQRISVSSKNLEDSFGVAFNNSSGFQMFLGLMNQLLGDSRSLQDTAASVGDAFGKAFLVITPAVNAVVTAFKTLWSVITDTADAIGKIFGGAVSSVFQSIFNFAPTAQNIIKGLGDAFVVVASIIQMAGGYLRDFIQVLGDSRGAIVGLAQSLGGILTGNYAQIATGITALSNTLPKAAQALVGKVTQTTKEGLAATQKAVDDYNASVDKAFSQKAKRPPIPKPTYTDDAKTNTKQAKDDLAEQLALNKEKLDAKKAEIAEEQRLDDDAYNHSQETMAQHYARQADLINQGYQAQLVYIQSNLKAQSQMIAAELAAQTITAQQAATRMSTARIKAQTETVNAVKSLQKELAQNNTKQDRDTLAQIVDQQSKAVAMAKDVAAAQRQQLSGKLSRGEITPDAYNQGQIAAITQLAQAQISAAQAVYDAQTKYGHDITASQKQEETNTKAIFDAQKALNQLRDDQAGKAQSYVNKLYQPQQKAIEDQMQAQKELGPGADQQGGKSQQQLQQEVLQNLASQKTALEQAIQLATPYSEQWYSIYENIEKVYAAQVKYNQELQKSRDLAKPIGEAFGSIGEGISASFRSSFGQNLGQAFSQGGKSLTQSNDRRSAIFGSPVVKKDPAQQKLEDEATSIFKNAGDSAHGLVSPFGNLTAAINKATEALGSLTEKSNRVGGPPSVGSSSDIGGVDLDKALGSGLPGALPAYSSGGLLASLKRSVTGIFKGNSSSNSSDPTANAASSIGDFTKKLQAGIGAVTDFVSSIMNAKSALSGIASGGLAGASAGNTFGGPIGAAIGAGIGAVLGGIVGQKENEVKNNINNLETSQKQIMQSYNENTNNLQQTITQMAGLIAQAQAEQASSKKGGSQYQNLIQQYNQQLVQLQTQQAQILHQFNEQLAVLSAPTGMQQYLSTLQQIVDQYNQFAGAAQNATDLANANQFLTSSLQQYTVQMAQQFGQEETSAIQDALDLNTLLQQRVQYMSQINDQIRGVLTQGVLTRTSTFAQTKGQQVEQIQYNYDLQIDQMNMQIAVDQNKVASETQVFNLATTRIGLETELIALQNNQTNYQMQQIAALGQLLGIFQTGQFSGTPVGNLLNSIPSTTTPVGTANPLQQLLTGAYQGFASLGLYNLKGATG